MKLCVSLGTSLIAAGALVAGCSGPAPSKADVANACMTRMGGVQAKCDCFVGSLEKALAPTDFVKLAQGARDNQKFGGVDWLPNSVSTAPEIRSALQAATAACLSNNV